MVTISEEDKEILENLQKDNTRRWDVEIHKQRFDDMITRWETSKDQDKTQCAEQLLDAVIKIPEGNLQTDSPLLYTKKNDAFKKAIEFAEKITSEADAAFKTAEAAFKTAEAAASEAKNVLETAKAKSEIKTAVNAITPALNASAAASKAKAAFDNAKVNLEKHNTVKARIMFHHALFLECSLKLQNKTPPAKITPQELISLSQRVSTHTSDPLIKKAADEHIKAMEMSVQVQVQHEMREMESVRKTTLTCIRLLKQPPSSELHEAAVNTLFTDLQHKSDVARILCLAYSANQLHPNSTKCKNIIIEMKTIMAKEDFLKNDPEMKKSLIGVLNTQPGFNNLRREMTEHLLSSEQGKISNLLKQKKDTVLLDWLKTPEGFTLRANSGSYSKLLAAERAESKKAAVPSTPVSVPLTTPRPKK